jgi:hypothetical protein
VYSTLNEYKDDVVISERGRQEGVHLTAIIKSLRFVTLHMNAVTDAIEHV